MGYRSLRMTESRVRFSAGPLLVYGVGWFSLSDSEGVGVTDGVAVPLVGVGEGGATSSSGSSIGSSIGEGSGSGGVSVSASASSCLTWLSCSLVLISSSSWLAI